MDVLNLGTGFKPLVHEGWDIINHDLRLDPERPWVTVAWDLNEHPWPWAEESFDLIVACAVFEHLRRNLIETLNECWRILRPQGVLYMKLPYWNHEISYIDPTHYWQFSLRTVEIFDPDKEYGLKYRFYTDRKWKIIQVPKLNDTRSSFSVKMEVRK